MRILAEAADASLTVDSLSVDIREVKLSRLASSVSSKIRLALQSPHHGPESEDRDQWHTILGAFIQTTIEEFTVLLDRLTGDRPLKPFAVNVAVEDLRSHLITVLSRLISRVFVLELNIHRLKGVLLGDTPEERYRFFISYLRQSGNMLRLLDTYPVLADDMERHCWQVLQAHIELYSRLVQDWELLAKTFFESSDNLILKHLETELGDQHNEGRTVCLLHFNNDRKLIYKPRSLASDEAFHDLLLWVNAKNRTRSHLLATLEVLNKGDYGWMEFVPTEPCDDAAQVHGFYVRIGKLLAILYILHATDFHYGNLIAKQAFPLLIDLEGLFHGILRVDSSSSSNGADVAMANSVLTTGLLPRRLSFDKSLDTSGIGGEAGQPLPWEVSHWETPGTDQMRVGKKAAEFAGGLNRPVLNGEPQSAVDYCDDIVSGFSEVYQLAAEFKAELVSGEGPLQGFARCSLRTILRPTYIYAQILMDLRHPDNLRNFDARSTFLSKLDQTCSDPKWLEIIRAEKEELRRGDIPYFTTAGEICDIESSSGTRIQDALGKSGYQAAIERIKGLGPADFDLQVNLIRSAVSSISVSLHASDRSKWVKGRLKSTSHVPLDGARDIALHLCDSAIRHNGRTDWLGLTLKPGNFLSVEPLGLDLYSGLPGVCLFLAYYSLLADCRRIETLAEQALQSVQSRITNAAGGLTFVGGYAGVGGLVKVMLLLDQRWPGKGLLEVAQSLVSVLAEHLQREVSYDYVYGAAGAIAALLALDRVSPSPSVIETAQACGDLLVSKAVPQSVGVGWLSPISPNAPLSGFSHGVAGIASALFDLWHRTSRLAYFETALSALEYERSLYLPSKGNWKDLRPELSSNVQPMRAWCHGASGVGLSRLLIATCMSDLTLVEEIRVSLDTTLQGGFGGNHSLCHGDLGNLEICSALARYLGETSKLDMLTMQRETMLTNAQQTGWICGNPGGEVSPGLMTGLAGIGYGLLRLDNSKDVPSVLCF